VSPEEAAEEILLAANSSFPLPFSSSFLPFPTVFSLSFLLFLFPLPLFFIISTADVPPRELSLLRVT